MLGFPFVIAKYFGKIRTVFKCRFLCVIKDFVPFGVKLFKTFKEPEETAEITLCLRIRSRNGTEESVRYVNSVTDSETDDFLNRFAVTQESDEPSLNRKISVLKDIYRRFLRSDESKIERRVNAVGLNGRIFISRFEFNRLG